MVTGNSYFPKERNSCPETVLKMGAFSSFFNDLTVFPLSLNNISGDTRLAAAPVSINPLVRISKIKIGVLMSCGRFVLLLCVRLFMANIEFMATFSHSSGCTVDWREPYPSNIL